MDKPGGTSQNPTQKHPHPPTVTTIDTQPKQNQKIATSSREPEGKKTCFITQDDVDIVQIMGWSVDNTRAKQMTQTITQEFAIALKDCILLTHINPTRDMKEYARSILDEEMGECLEYRHLLKHPKYKDTWSHSYGNKIGRLAQGMPGWVNETNTIFI